MIDVTKNWFFEKINKIDKPLTRLMEKKGVRTQINKIRNEREGTTNTREIERFEWKYYERPSANNLDEVGKFLETYSLPKLNQEELENMNRRLQHSKIEAVKKPQKTPKQQKLWTDGFICEFYQSKN